MVTVKVVTVNNSLTYLAAFARSAGMKLATLDRGFRKFDKLELVLLS